MGLDGVFEQNAEHAIYQIGEYDLLKMRLCLDTLLIVHNVIQEIKNLTIYDVFTKKEHKALINQEEGHDGRPIISTRLLHFDDTEIIEAEKKLKELESRLGFAIR